MKKKISTRTPRRRIPHTQTWSWSVALLMTSGAFAEGDPAPAKDAAAPEAAKTEEKKDDTAKKDEAAKSEADYKNWMTFSVGGVLTTGRASAFEHRAGVPTGAFGGVEDFHYEQDAGKSGTFKMDGHGLFDRNDYGIRLELSGENKGFIRLGYSQYREWYDGGGGYFPGTGPGQTPQWFNLYDSDLHLDRSNFTVEAGLRMPKLPEVTLRYSRETREGDKDSTSWGAASVGDGTLRGVVPSFWTLDEVRNLISLDVTKKFGKTDVGIGLRYEHDDLNNTLNSRQFPGDTGDAKATQREGQKTDLFGAHGYASSRLSKKVFLSAGYSFMEIDTDTSGYRVYGSTYDPDLAQRLPNVNTFQALSGGSRLDQNLMNVNLLYTPKEAWAVIPSLKVDNRDWDGASTFSLPAQPYSPMPYAVSSTRDLLDVSGDLEVRYSGVTNWVFYAAGDWMQGSGDLTERSDNLQTGAAVLRRVTDDNRFVQKYEAGANWYPLRKLNFSLEYYRKMRANDYTHTEDSTPNLPGSPNTYPAFLRAQDYDTDDVNFRVAWRPLPSLSLVGRYDFQLSTINTQPDYLVNLQTAKMTSHIISGNATWNATSRLYLLGGASYVIDRTDSPSDGVLTALQQSRNDYWTVNAGFGYALDNKSDFDAQYYYYRADNFVDNSIGGMPYGAGFEEHGITAGVTRKLTARTRLALKYGFFTSNNEQYGGNLNYDAHLIYSSLQYRF